MVIWIDKLHTDRSFDYLLVLQRPIQGAQYVRVYGEIAQRTTSADSKQRK